MYNLKVYRTMFSGIVEECATLVAMVKDQAVWPKALDGSGKCGRTSMGGFLPVDVYIIIDEHGTSHGGDAYCFVFQSHFFDNLATSL